MSKIFRRSSCQKASDGTDGAHRWRLPDALRQSERGLPLPTPSTEAFLKHVSFSVRLKRRFPAPAIYLPDTARSLGQDLARQRQPQRGVVLTEASTGSRSNGRRLLSCQVMVLSAVFGSRNMASGRAAPLCPERGHPEGAATKDSRLPGLVPAGTCSRLDQAELGRPMNGPDMLMPPRLGNCPS